MREYYPIYNRKPSTQMYPATTHDWIQQSAVLPAPVLVPIQNRRDVRRVPGVAWDMSHTAPVTRLTILN